MAQTHLTWYGQAGFKIVTPANKVLLIDPWLTNPVFTKGKEELAALKDVDLILLSHGHSDHVGDAVEIGKKTDAKLVATYDLSAAMTTALGYPSNLADSETPDISEDNSIYSTATWPFVLSRPGTDRAFARTINRLPSMREIPMD